MDQTGFRLHTLDREGQVIDGGVFEATNDFVAKFANVNGSGSGSANELFARPILRMGVPLAARARAGAPWR